MSRTTHKFDYPHPLIKNLNQTKHYTQSNVQQLIKQKPCLYENNYTFSPNIKSIISPKLLRLSNTKIIPEQQFGILMQPFNTNQEVQKIILSNQQKTQMKCKNCHSYFNSYDQSISVNEIKCKICQKVQQVEIQMKNKLEMLPSCWDFISKDFSDIQNTLNNTIQKNICFVIQASEFNYNYRIHQVIESFINSLKYVINQQQMQQIADGYKQHQQGTDDGQISQTSIKYNQINKKSKIRYNVGFILFNDKNLFVINQLTNDLLSFSSQFLLSQLQNSQQKNRSKKSILPFNQMFHPINQITNQTFELVRQILYQSYLKKQSCLDFATNFISEYVDNYFLNQNEIGLNQNFQPQKRQVQYKFFVNSLRCNNQSHTNKLESKNPQTLNSNLFNNVTNTFTEKIPSLFNINGKNNKGNSNCAQQFQDHHQSSSSLNLLPNYQFFYLPKTSAQHQYPQKQVIKKFNNNLQRMYTPKKITTSSQQTFNTIYYDLFQNLSTIQKYHQIKVKIITSDKIQILAVGNKELGYNDFVANQEFRKINRSGDVNNKFNQYEITLKSLESSHTLPIDLKINSYTNTNGNKNGNKNRSSHEGKHWMQIGLEYKKGQFEEDIQKTLMIPCQRVFQLQITSLNRPINFNHHIYSSLSTYVDDQILFYFHLRSVLIQCHKTKTNHTIIKKLHNKMMQISQNFKNQYGQIDFHRQYSRIFLYSFMINNHDLVNSTHQNFFYQRHLWLKSSFECLSKTIYPRTYEFVRNKQSLHIQSIKNIKTSPKGFKSNSINLIDNGRNILLIIGEDTQASQLKKIFGTCYVNEIRQLSELPELQQNEKQRELIDLARRHHESNYLPLKIVQLFSPQFQQQVADSLYIKDNHYSYMRVLWDMKPVGRKAMR